jgi:deoxyhypusine monooxygenase
MTIENPSSLSSYADALLNRSGNTPLAVRFRALFALKALAGEGNNKAVDIIAEGSPFPICLPLGFRDESELLKHELAYVLGQTGNLYAVKYLEDVLQDPEQQEIVRHEVARVKALLTPGC